MENTEDTTLAAHDATGELMDSARLEIWLSELSRLKRLSAELRGENDRLRGERDRQRHEIRDRDERIKVLGREVANERAHLEKARHEIAELQRHLNSKAARWAFALRRAFRRVVPGRGQVRQ